MSDPAMAAGMEVDIRFRFWVALALSAVIVLLSPMGKMSSLLHITLPPPGCFWHSPSCRVLVRMDVYLRSL